MENFKLTYDQVKNYLGKNIRKDTYLCIMRLVNGEDYIDIIKDLDAHRAEYGIKMDVALVSKDTCYNYMQNLSNACWEEIEIEEAVNKEKNQSNHPGIYAIYADNQIIYIGSTKQSFKEAYKRHLSIVNHPKEQEQYVYKIIRNKKEQGCKISLKPLVDFNDIELKEGQNLRDRDINAMVLGLIKTFDPIGNAVGRFIPFAL